MSSAARQNQPYLIPSKWRELTGCYRDGFLTGARPSSGCAIATPDFPEGSSSTRIDGARRTSRHTACDGLAGLTVDGSVHGEVGAARPGNVLATPLEGLAAAARSAPTTGAHEFSGVVTGGTTYDKTGGDCDSANGIKGESVCFSDP